MKHTLGVLAVFATLGLSAQTPTENDYYKIITLPVPEGIELEVGGLTGLPTGSLAAATRRPRRPVHPRGRHLAFGGRIPRAGRAHRAVHRQRERALGFPASPAHHLGWLVVLPRGSDPMNTSTRLWRNARLATLTGEGWGLIDQGALVTEGDRIAWAGPQAGLPAHLRPAHEHDLGRRGRLAGGLGHDRGSLGGGLRVPDVDPLPVERPLRHVDVVVPQAGQDPVTVEVDLLSRPAREAAVILPVFVGHQESFSGPMG